MALLFLTAALLQWNDPDPAWWFLIYVAAVVACVGAGRWKGAIWLASFVCGASLVWAAILVPRVLPRFEFSHLFESMKAETPAIELSREILGLLIISAWMGVLIAYRPARRHA